MGSDTIEELPVFRNYVSHEALVKDVCKHDGEGVSINGHDLTILNQSPNVDGMTAFEGHLSKNLAESDLRQLRRDVCQEDKIEKNRKARQKRINDALAKVGILVVNKVPPGKPPFGKLPKDFGDTSSDWGLIELDQPPAGDKNVFFSGWDVFDGIQEQTVQTGKPPAELGGSKGKVANIVTKTGIFGFGGFQQGAELPAGAVNFAPLNNNPNATFNKNDTGTNVYGGGFRLNFQKLELEIYGDTGSSNSTQIVTSPGFIPSPDGNLAGAAGLSGATTYFLDTDTTSAGFKAGYEFFQLESTKGEKIFSASAFGGYQFNSRDHKLTITDSFTTPNVNKIEYDMDTHNIDFGGDVKVSPFGENNRFLNPWVSISGGGSIWIADLETDFLLRGATTTQGTVKDNSVQVGPFYGVEVGNKTPLNDFVSLEIGGFFTGRTAASIKPADQSGRTDEISQEMVHGYGGFVDLKIAVGKRLGKKGLGSQEPGLKEYDDFYKSQDGN